jgi:hypothetical protein
MCHFATITETSVGPDGWHDRIAALTSNLPIAFTAKNRRNVWQQMN